MTDNRTTELREKLDELGIEHHDFDKGGRTQTLWESPEGMRHFTYETAANPAKTAKLTISWFPTPEQAIAATLGSDREAELIRAIEDVLRHSTDTVWAGEIETLVDRMVSLGVYGHDVYEGARPWEASE